MNRDDIITAIFAVRPEAIRAGFCWPSDDSTETVSTETLVEFLAEVNEFLQANGD